MRLVLVFLAVFFCFSSKCFSQLDIEKTGDIVQLGLPVGAFAISCFDGDSYENFLYSMIATQVVTHTVKRTLNRERPNGGDFSFPSGHTSCAFQAASFLHFKYGWKVGLPSFALAGFVGWSRFHADKHYISDILAGAALGVFMSYICIEKDVRIFTSSKKIEDQDAYALNLQLSF